MSSKTGPAGLNPWLPSRDTKRCAVLTPTKGSKEPLLDSEASVAPVNSARQVAWRRQRRVLLSPRFGATKGLYQAASPARGPKLRIFPGSSLGGTGKRCSSERRFFCAIASLGAFGERRRFAELPPPAQAATSGRGSPLGAMSRTTGRVRYQNALAMAARKSARLRLQRLVGGQVPRPKWPSSRGELADNVRSVSQHRTERERSPRPVGTGQSAPSSHSGDEGHHARPGPTSGSDRSVPPSADPRQDRRPRWRSPVPVKDRSSPHLSQSLSTSRRLPGRLRAQPGIARASRKLGP